MQNELLEKWHKVVFEQNNTLLDEVLADDVEFHSPTVRKPMHGKSLVTLVLKSVLVVTENFTYHREWVMPTTDENGNTGCEMALEFSADLVDDNGKTWHLKAIDLIRWNAEGKVVHLEVMARPMKAVNVLYEKMTAQVMQGLAKAN